MPPVVEQLERRAAAADRPRDSSLNVDSYGAIDLSVFDEVDFDFRQIALQAFVRTGGIGLEAAIQGHLQASQKFIERYGEAARQFRFSAQVYSRMIAAGAFEECGPAELLDGSVLLKMPKTRMHSLATKLCRSALEAVAPKSVYVDSQEPINVPEMTPGRGNVPEPDVMLVEGSPGDYPDDHPPSSKVRLVVEVSVSTLSISDRGIKHRLYAHGKVPEYWILNLPERQLEIHQQPTGTGENARYKMTSIVKPDGIVSLRFGNKTVSIPVHSLFPVE